jgi:MFS family permease
MLVTDPERSAPGGTMTLIRDRRVAIYLFAVTVVSIAGFLQAAALGKQVFDLTGSALALGFLGLAEFIPSVLLVPITGVVADRFDRRRVAAITYVGEVACSVVLVLYLLSDPTETWPLYVVAGVFGALRSFAWPAARSIPPLVAPEGTLARLMAVNSLTWQVGLVVGPVTAGFLLDVGPAAPYVIAAVLAGVGTVAMTAVTYRRPQDRSLAEQRPTWAHAFEGLRFIKHTPVVRGAILLDLFAVLFGGAVALLPAIAEERLGVGNVGYGWLRAAPGIGALAMTLVLAARPPARRVGRLLYVVVAIFGVGTLVLGITRSFVVAMIAVLVLSAADAVSVMIRSTLLPLATPDETRGRVSAVEAVFVGASNELGAFSSGVTGQLFGIGPAVVLGGAATLVVVGVWWVRYPQLRDVDRFSDVEVAT